MRRAIIGLSLLFLVSMLSLPVHAVDVDLTELDERIGEALGIGAFAGGLLVTVIFLFVIFGCLGAVTKRRPSDLMVLIIGTVVLSCAIAVGWFPVWSLVALVFVISLLFGQKIIKGVKG